MYIIHRRHRIGFNPYEYNDASVTVLTEDRLRVRATPKLYLPNVGKEGALHLIEEVVANAIDEISSPGSVGNEVIVIYDERTKTVIVQDNGRGFPFNKLFDMCEVLNSSAKMGEGARAYSTSGGVHGMGLKLVNYFTEYMTIHTEREGKSLKVHYVDGLRKEVKHGKSKETGTSVEWKYDKRFFTDINITCEDILTMLRLKSYVLRLGASVIFKGKLKDGSDVLKEFKDNTLKDFLKQHSISVPPIEISDIFGGDSIHAMFSFNSEATEGYTFAAYTNNIFNKLGGSHVDGILEGINSFFRSYLYDEYLSDKEKKELKIKAEDSRLGLVGIVSVHTHNPSFEGGQHKALLGMNSVKNFAFRATRKVLRQMDKSKLNKFAAIIKANAKARQASEESKKRVKKDITNAFSADKIENFRPISKRSTRSDTEMFIVEGLSAMGAMEAVADRDTQALLAIRGKLDNVFDLTPEEAVNKSEFVSNMVDIFGCGIGKTFDIKKFPYERIYLATDADTDGNEIACQGAMIFFRFFEPVVTAGKLYRAVPPLYEIRQDGKSMFVPTSRIFLTITQQNFVKQNTVYLNGKPLRGDHILDLLMRNETYVTQINRIADEYAISPILCEFLIKNQAIGFGNDTVDKWSKALARNFTFLKVQPGEFGISIVGMIKTEFNLFDYVKEFSEDIQTISLDREFYGYSINDKDKSHLSLYETLKEFEKFQPNIISRFKGLGEMNSKDMKRTIMERKVRHSIRLTARHLQDTYDKLAVMHSRRPNYQKLRKEFISNFKFDIMDIDT